MHFLLLISRMQYTKNKCYLNCLQCNCLLYSGSSNPQTLPYTQLKQLNKYIACSPEHRCFSVWLAASEACSPSWLGGCVNPHRSAHRLETRLSEGFIISITLHLYSIWGLQLRYKWIPKNISLGDSGTLKIRLGKLRWRSKYPREDWFGYLRVKRSAGSI